MTPHIMQTLTALQTAVWHTTCNNSINSSAIVADHGTYEIQVWYSARAGSGNGFALGNAITRGTGVNSWWDINGDPNSFNEYAEGQQWLIYANFSSSINAILDESPNISQSVSVSGNNRIITLSSGKEYDFPVKSYGISIENLQDLTYAGVSLNWSAAGYTNLVNGEVHIIQYDNTTLYITTPHLSERVYNATLASSFTASARISPISPYSFNNLLGYCNTTSSSNATVTFSYNWYKNGVLNESGNLSGIEYDAEYNFTCSGSSSCSDAVDEDFGTYVQPSICQTLEVIETTNVSNYTNLNWTFQGRLRRNNERRRVFVLLELFSRRLPASQELYF